MAITTIPGANGSDLTTLKGTELADSFVLTANSLYIDALEGADTVTAANAVDKITAAAGAGGDSLTFLGAVSGSNFDLGEGNDTTSFQDFAGSLIGGTGNDNIDVNRAAENSTLKGNAGNDLFTFDTTVSSSKIFGNADDDSITVTGATTGSTIFGGKQQDQITVAAVTNGLLRGDKGSDTITVTGDIDSVVIQGNADADQIIVSSTKVTSSTVFGGAGADNLDISSGAMLVRGDDGNDDIDLTGNAKYTVSGGAGNDAIDSTSNKASKYFGGKGNDTITAATSVSSGNNVINGDAGNDNITGANDAELIDGGAGKDTITGAGGKDTIFGKAGADSIDVSGGTAANLNVLGGADNDTIKLTDADLNSDDVIKGEAGTDVLQFSDDAAGLADVQFKGVSGIETIDIDTINGTATFGANAQTAGITKIDASGVAAGTFTIDASAFTSSAALTITSTKNDIDSTIKGGSGNDTLNTNVDGEVVMTGGAGVDLFVHTSDEVASITDLSGTDNFTVNAVAATGVLTATVTANYVAGTTTQNQGTLGQAVITSSGFDVNMGSVTSGTTGFVINGNATAATLQGSGLADSITGGSAADSIVGNSGADVLVGGAQNDTIVAGAGNDTIKIAGTAQHQFAGDSINGGTGTDVISLANGVDTLTAEFDMDNITDVLQITTAGAGANGKDTTITFSAITETTAQVVNVNAASLTNGAGDLVIVNNSARATTTFNITGGAEGDSIVGGLGNDTINAAAGADLLTGALGNDVINLTVDAEVDEIVTAATAALTGVDTITDFLQGAGGDIYNADAFSNATAVNTTALTANPGSTTATEDDVNFLVEIALNQDITTQAGLTTALASGGEYANVDMAANKKAVFVTAVSEAAGVTQHVFFASSDGSGVITATKVAELTGSLLDINLYNEDNFNKLS